jgi:hypothetical protein
MPLQGPQTLGKAEERHTEIDPLISIDLKNLSKKK